MKINKMDFLISLYIACIILAEIMGGKTFRIAMIGSFHLNASVAILILPLVFTINDIVTEVFGAERARSIVRSGLCVIVFLLVFSAIAVRLPPSARFAKTNPAYQVIFSTTMRISFASLTAFGLAEFADVLIFAKLRRRFGKKRLWLRNNASNFISQLIDTAVFLTLAFYAFDKPLADNISFLTGLILPYWLLKCLMSIIETPFVYAGVQWLKGEKA